MKFLYRTRDEQLPYIGTRSAYEYNICSHAALQCTVPSWRDAMLFSVSCIILYRVACGRAYKSMTTYAPPSFLPTGYSSYTITCFKLLPTTKLYMPCDIMYSTATAEDGMRVSDPSTCKESKPRERCANLATNCSLQ
jgi:hypothetical protein